METKVRVKRIIQNTNSTINEDTKHIKYYFIGETICERPVTLYFCVLNGDDKTKTVIVENGCTYNVHYDILITNIEEKLHSYVVCWKADEILCD